MDIDGLGDATARLAQLEQDLQLAESADSRRAALEALVAAFPLLYGYWIKLAAESEDPAALWQRALKQCPTLELWSAFLQTDSGASALAAEDALAAMGQHFQGEPIWDIYLARASPERAAEKLKEVLRIPLYAYSKYFQQVYEQHLEPVDVLARLSEETAAGVTARWAFESRISRFYFHTPPLAVSELEAWDEYLDFEESEGDGARISLLYTRCLTATALYPGFWLRYIRWLGLDGRQEQLDSAFTSAFHYHPDHPTLNLLHLRMLEQRGAVAECREKLVARGDAAELAAFDVRQSLVNAEPTLPEYALERAKQTGDLSLLPPEVKQSGAMFQIPSVDPVTLFPLWQQGLCPDSRAYAARLRASGALAEFFEVDSTLGYGA